MLNSAAKSLIGFLLICFISSLLFACGTQQHVVEPANLPKTEPVVVPKVLKPIRIGLALGGGAARGFAHIGVIKALEAQKINADVIVGTSAGSVVGAMYAAGFNGFELHKLALSMDEATISDWTLPFFSSSSGLLKGEALQNYVNKMVSQVQIQNLKKKFGAVATDLNTGTSVLFQQGNTGQAVRASSSVPGFFQPVKIRDRLYVDGGLVSPVPVSFARDMGADFVIAVNVSSNPDSAPTSSTLEILAQTFTIMGQSINQHELKDNPNLVVIKPNLTGMKSGDFKGRDAAILAGEQAVAAKINEIKQKIQALQER